MKKRSLISVILLCGLIAIGMFSGYYIGLNQINKKPAPQIEKVENEPNMFQESEADNISRTNEYEHETGFDEEIIGPNTIIEHKILYSECNHEIIETLAPEANTINMTKDRFEAFVRNNHPKWKVEHFSNKNIIIFIEKNHLCQNHYVIGEKDGKIAVFRIDENGYKVLDKVYNDAPISLLKDIDQEKIKKGIVTDNKEELTDILENYIS